MWTGDPAALQSLGAQNSPFQSWSASASDTRTIHESPDLSQPPSLEDCPRPGRIRPADRTSAASRRRRKRRSASLAGIWRFSRHAHAQPCGYPFQTEDDADHDTTWCVRPSEESPWRRSRRCRGRPWDASSAARGSTRKSDTACVAHATIRGASQQAIELFDFPRFRSQPIHASSRTFHCRSRWNRKNRSAWPTPNLRFSPATPARARSRIAPSSGASSVLVSAKSLRIAKWTTNRDFAPAPRRVRGAHRRRRGSSAWSGR